MSGSAEPPAGDDRGGGNADPASPDPDHAWKALNLVNDWVKHAETKSVAVLAAAGVAGGVAYNLLKDQAKPGLVLSVVATVACLAIFLAGLSAMAALAPQLRVPTSGRWQVWLAQLRHGSRRTAHAHADDTDADEAQDEAERNPTNLLFYGDIKREYEHDAPTYSQVLATLTGNDREITNHLALQVHANSMVAHRKYTWANRAIRALRVGLIGLALIALIIAKHWSGS